MTGFTVAADGIVVSVRLTPRGGRDGVDGPRRLADGREVLAVRVRALPEDGAANAALAGVLADRFGVARSAVTIATGAGSRIKQVKVAGDARTLAAIAEALFRPAD